MTPFTIEIPQAQVDDLQARLRSTRWPGGTLGDGTADGFGLDAQRALVRQWAEDFDWRAQEARLDRLPQFTTTIDGLRIHVVHVAGAGRPRPLPGRLLGPRWRPLRPVLPKRRPDHLDLVAEVDGARRRSLPHAVRIPTPVANLVGCG